MTPPPIGHAASFLLGMLVGSPKTADELHALLPACIDLLDENEDLVEAMGTREVVPALVSMYDAGAEEVERRLERLVEFALVDCLEAGRGARLYARR